MDNRAVGVMDSGVGGLTVARVLAEKYPKEGIVFLGDTARNPYGERPVEEIVRFSEAIKDFLLKKDVKMILVACNTISFNVPPSFLEGDVPVIKMSMNVALPEDAKNRCLCNAGYDFGPFAQKVSGKGASGSGNRRDPLRGTGGCH